MKCPKCNAVNKKTDERCKKCNELLHEENKEEVVVANEVKEEIKEEPLRQVEEDIKIVEKKKRKNPFRRIILTIKIILLLLVIAIIGLVVYIYTMFDYNKYYEDNMIRYYETENKQYLNSIKLLFKVYRLDDNKISKMQDKGLDITSLWVDEIKNNEYSLVEAYKEDLNCLERVINALYTETEYEGHTAISKKTYNSLTFSIKELKNILEESQNENLGEIEEIEEPEKVTVTEYDVSKFSEIDINKALNLFEQKDLAILYMGRETCHYCVKYVPIITSVQKKLGFKTYYLDTEKIDVTNEAFNKFIAKVDKMDEIKGEKKTIGEFFQLYGYTPITIIIKDGKMIDGEIGYLEEDVLTELISKYL